jgi:glycine/D-amino acid oxidase-like deaminating enzyme
MNRDSMPDDVVIVGAGVVGSAIACFLARDHGVAATVLERDPTYARASSALSASSIRQQFTTPVNIALSRASFDFYLRIGDELEVGGERPDIGLVERAYLYLANASQQAALRANHLLQRAQGVDAELLDAQALSDRFAWLATGDLALGSLGRSGEGWFDGWSVLQALRRKAIACGARFATADAEAIELDGGRVAAVRCAGGMRIAARTVVVAAGAWSAPLAASIGIDLPVRARKRDVFVFETPAQIQACPLVIDPSGVWFRPESSRFLCGAPPRGDDLDDAPLDAIDHGLFDDVIWPALARRVPAFEALRLVSAWAGYYEMNLFDHNAFVGAWPGIDGLYVACGFSGHGMQHAPAVGRAAASLLATGTWGPLDLSPLAPDRLLRGARLVEGNVI